MPGSCSHWSSYTLKGLVTCAVLLPLPTIWVAASTHGLAGGQPKQRNGARASVRRDDQGTQYIWAIAPCGHALFALQTLSNASFHCSVHVGYTPSESYRPKRLNHPHPQRPSPIGSLPWRAWSPVPEGPLDLHFGPWQVSRIGSVNNITQSGIAL